MIALARVSPSPGSGFALATLSRKARKGRGFGALDCRKGINGDDARSTCLKGAGTLSPCGRGWAPRSGDRVRGKRQRSPVVRHG